MAEKRDLIDRAAVLCGFQVSADVLARFTALANQRRFPSGALLEQLLDEIRG
jgi:hypothetical protein